MNDLRDKIIIVTGGGRGIGRAIAEEFTRYGAHVVVADITEDSAESFAALRSIRRKTKGFPMTVDVSESKDVKMLVATVIEKLGRIDILVNNAGIIGSGFIVDLNEEDWDTIIRVNAKSVFLCCREVAKHMIDRKRGKIINIASQAAKTGEAGNGPYCASKAAVVSLTQVLALELAQFNINVNAICPGYTDTEMMKHVFEKRGKLVGISPEEYKKQLCSGVPLKRMASPEEIAQLVVFLASEKSNYITGETINISGGKEFH
jgi:NAD(P)-dependent dehydrogenase (short-subunit alcohol dehydrogenase family)